MVEENPKLLDCEVVETPNLIAAYKELASLNIKAINSETAFRLYDTFGIDEEGIQKLAKTLDLHFNAKELTMELENAKLRSKKEALDLDSKLYQQLVADKVPKTDDSYKYFYLKDRSDSYVFKDIDVEVLRIYDNEKPVESVGGEYYCSLLLDKTNCYSEAGGQVMYNLFLIFESAQSRIKTWKSCLPKLIKEVTKKIKKYPLSSTLVAPKRRIFNKYSPTIK